MNQYEHIDDLIAKHLAGETTTVEDDIVNKWVASSGANNLYYSELKTIHELSGVESIQDKINVDAAWSKFSKKMPRHSDEKSIPKKGKTIIKKLTAAFYSKAALFVCMLGFGYFIYNHLNQKERLIVFSSSASTTRNTTLPDGSFVVLNPKSSIIYSSSFNKTNRELKLVGEASFHVQHMADLPFIVNTGSLFVKDIGTSFTIKAIPSDSTVRVHVKEGEVIFYSFQNSGMTLIKNETGIYNLISETFRKQNNDVFNAVPETSLTLSFENTNLRFVIDTLNKAYNEHIILSCEELETLKLTAEFKEKTAMPIIETIAETFGLSVTKTNGTVSLNSRVCKD